MQLHSLPPTSAAASYHIARVYLQVQQCMGKGEDLDPEEWGWLRVRNRLEPIMTDLPPAPEALRWRSSDVHADTIATHEGALARNTDWTAELRVVNARASSNWRENRSWRKCIDLEAEYCG